MTRPSTDALSTNALSSTTAADVTGQFDAWPAIDTALAKRGPALHQAWNNLDVDEIVFTGCGSVHYLALTSAVLAQRALGVRCRAVPGAALLEPGAFPIVDPARTLLVTASRSGETSEIVRAAERFRANGGAAVWTITTRSGSTLARSADELLAVDDGYEPSVVQTRSFSSLLALSQGLIEALAGWTTLLADQADRGSASLTALDARVEAWGGTGRFDRVVVLGSTVGIGVAQEAMLLMNEVALTDAVAHPYLDFRHGPMAMVDDRTLVVALADPTVGAAELEVVAEAAAHGATPLVVWMASTPGGEPPTVAGLLADHFLEVDPAASGRLALLMPALQRLALHRAAARAVDPDVPRHLTAVVILDDAPSPA